MYDSDFPDCLSLLGRVKVTLDGERSQRTQSPECLLALGFYWRRVLQAQSSVVVSVTERSQRDLTEQSNQT